MFGRAVVLWAVASSCYGAPAVLGVVNAASYKGNIAPGTWVAIFGTELAPSRASADRLPLPTSLNGVSVTVDGVLAPLLYVAADQINALIPSEVAPRPTGGVPLVVTTPGSSSASYFIELWRNAPGIFTQNAAGTGTVLAFDNAFQPVSAAGSDPMILYATGLGPTDVMNRTVDDVSVFIGDTKATVSYAGLAPGFPGIYQLNVTPNGPMTDRVYIQVKGWNSNIASLPPAAGSNVTNIVGSIDSVYPTQSSPPMAYSVVPFVGTFNVAFDILPGARPFSVVATVESARASFDFDPANGTWQANISVPTAAARLGDLSATEFLPILNFATCRSMGTCSSFPAGLIPVSLLDVRAFSALSTLPQLNTSSIVSGNGIFHGSGTIRSDGHFAMDRTFGEFMNFASFVQIAEPGPAMRSTTLRLYVDGKLVASKEVRYSVLQP